MQDQLGLRPRRGGVWRDCWKVPEACQGASGSPSHFTLGALVCRCLGGHAVPPVRCPLMGSWRPFRARGAGQSCLGGGAVSDPCRCPSGLGEDGEVSQDPPSCQAGPRHEWQTACDLGAPGPVHQPGLLAQHAGHGWESCKEVEAWRGCCPHPLPEPGPASNACPAPACPGPTRRLTLLTPRPLPASGRKWQ